MYMHCKNVIWGGDWQGGGEVVYMYTCGVTCV